MQSAQSTPGRGWAVSVKAQVGMCAMLQNMLEGGVPAVRRMGLEESTGPWRPWKGLMCFAEMGGPVGFCVRKWYHPIFFPSPVFINYGSTLVFLILYLEAFISSQEIIKRVHRGSICPVYLNCYILCNWQHVPGQNQETDICIITDICIMCMCFSAVDSCSDHSGQHGNYAISSEIPLALP